METKRTQDPSELASNAVEALDNMSPRRHNDSRNELHTCRCGSMIVVPKGHDALDDEESILCHDCDKPLGVKMYETFAR